MDIKYRGLSDDNNNKYNNNRKYNEFLQYNNSIYSIRKKDENSYTYADLYRIASPNYENLNFIYDNFKWDHCSDIFDFSDQNALKEIANNLSKNQNLKNN